MTMYLTCEWVMCHKFNYESMPHAHGSWTLQMIKSQAHI